MTGASGFVGRLICLRLIEMDYRVRAFDRAEPDWTSADAEFISGDVTNREQVHVGMLKCTVRFDVTVSNVQLVLAWMLSFIVLANPMPMGLMINSIMSMCEEQVLTSQM